MQGRRIVPLPQIPCVFWTMNQPAKPLQPLEIKTPTSNPSIHNKHNIHLTSSTSAPHLGQILNNGSNDHVSEYVKAKAKNETKLINHSKDTKNRGGMSYTNCIRTSAQNGLIHSAKTKKYYFLRH